jgi:catechol 2,3-dioxygenase-like lactoylglutathione lyase family enzyme
MIHTISRRAFLAATGASLLAARVARSAEQVPKLLDHILLGCDDLDRGIAFVEEHTGVRAVFGGVHPGAGTQNALLSLGENRYLEIIAPDPKQPAGADIRNLRRLDDEPALVGWAAHHPDLDAFAARLKNQGFEIEGPLPGSRKRPDGRVLTWKVMRLKDDSTQLLPFFIEWSADSIHPSVDSPHGCELFRFEAFAPDADARAVYAQVQALGLDLPLAPGKKSFLAATIIGLKGELRVTS